MWGWYSGSGGKERESERDFLTVKKSKKRGKERVLLINRSSILFDDNLPISIIWSHTFQPTHPHTLSSRTHAPSHFYIIFFHFQTTIHYSSRESFRATVSFVCHVTRLTQSVICFSQVAKGNSASTAPQQTLHLCVWAVVSIQLPVNGSKRNRLRVVWKVVYLNRLLIWLMAIWSFHAAHDFSTSFFFHTFAMRQVHGV